MLVVAEGIMQYLSEKEAVELFNRITEKFPHGDIIFDVYSSLMTWAMNLVMSIKKAGFSMRGVWVTHISSRSRSSASGSLMQFHF